VTAGIGYCGLDRTRRPLNGDEIRGCWTGRPGDDSSAGPPKLPPVPPARLRGFVPLDVDPPRAEVDSAQVPAIPPPAAADPFERGTFFDLDR
jgi:hypothetical protein